MLETKDTVKVSAGPPDLAHGEVTAVSIVSKFSGFEIKKSEEIASVVDTPMVTAAEIHYTEETEKASDLPKISAGEYESGKSMDKLIQNEYRMI
jgi:hypothetical protein